MIQLYGKASALSSVEDNLPENAVDGNILTCWQAQPYHVWWMYDVHRICNIKQLIVETGTDAKYRYHIDVSMDYINWKTVVEKMTASKCAVGGDIWALDIDARYIRITFTYCSTGQKVQLSNFQAFGKKLDYVRRSELKYAERFYASTSLCANGFEKTIAPDILPGWSPYIMQSSLNESVLIFDTIDFGSGIDELRGYFGFPNPNRNLGVEIEIRIDSMHGKVIGKMQAFRQWEHWSELACEIELTSGRHSVFFIVKHVSLGQILQVCWLNFIKKAPLPQPLAVSAELPQSDDYRVFMGLLHSHTGFSDGKNVPEFAYAYARDTAKLDFLGITEHSNLFDEAFDCSVSRKFRDLFASAEAVTEDDKFVALVGSETTWYNQFGHMNIYAENLYINPYEIKYNDISTYYDLIKKYPHSINQWNHPWSCGSRHLDNFSPYDEDLDPLMCLLEVNPYENPDRDGLGYYIKALNIGYHVAPCGSQDNHKEDWGTQNNLRTAIISSRLTKLHIYDAIRQRRVYFTCSPDLKVLYFVNNHIMGSRIQPSERYDFHIQAEVSDQKTQIKSVEILGYDGRVVVQQNVQDNILDLHLQSSNSSDMYFFAKVTMDNGEFAVTSPVWID